MVSMAERTPSDTAKVVAALAAATTLIAVVAGVSAAQPGRGGDRTVPLQFHLAGSVNGLYPGGTRTLSVRIANPYPFAILVTDLKAHVDPAGPDCPADALTVTPVPSNVVVARDSESTYPFSASLDPSAPDGCQGAMWPITYIASAERATTGHGSPPPQ